jgi:iron(III) transport system substrate-binding protein
MQIGRPLTVGSIIAALLGPAISMAAEPNPRWQAEWEKVTAEAKREGQLGIIAEETFLPLLQEFKKKYPAINISHVGGPSGSQRTQKLMAERRAELYLRDIYIGSPWSHLVEVTYQVFDPFNPALILPEVVDQSKWWKGKYQYDDPKGQYIFIFEGAVKTGNIVYNKSLVSPQEIKSYWDLLNPKWKGKIVAVDHNLRSFGGLQDGLRIFYFHPGLGREFLTRLYSEMDVTLSRDQTQILDWVGSGKVALGFYNAGSQTEIAIRQGLPIGKFFAPNFKEGGIVNPQVGKVSLVNRAPHPNAAKLFINWLLSREGQISFQNVFVPRSHGDQGNSLREDIPKDILPPETRRDTCRNCMEYTLEMAETAPITSFINEVMAKAKK